MRRGHIPIRTCIACRRKRPASEMIRLKVSEETVIVVSRRQAVSGRGCYVCPTEECVDRALRKGCLARGLRRPIALPPSKEGLLSCLEQKG